MWAVLAVVSGALVYVVGLAYVSARTRRRAMAKRPLPSLKAPVALSASFVDTRLWPANWQQVGELSEARHWLEDIRLERQRAENWDWPAPPRVAA